MRHHRANKIVGADAILRPFDLRAGRRQLWPSLRAGRGLRTVAQGESKMQAVREDQQNRALPRLLSDLRLRGRSETGVPGDPDSAATHAGRRGRETNGSCTRESLISRERTCGPREREKIKRTTKASPSLSLINAFSSIRLRLFSFRLAATSGYRDTHAHHIHSISFGGLGSIFT